MTTKANCRWCGRSAEGEKNLCPGCTDELSKIPSLTVEELDLLPYGVIELDAAGKILIFNRAEAEMARVSHSQVIGKNFFTDVAPCCDVKHFRGHFGEFLQSGEMFEPFKFTYHFPHGTVNVDIVFVRVDDRNAFVVSKRALAA